MGRGINKSDIFKDEQDKTLTKIIEEESKKGRSSGNELNILGVAPIYQSLRVRAS
jgi:hypothetical protein